MPELSNISIIAGVLAAIFLILYIREYFLRKKGLKNTQSEDIVLRQKTAELLKASESIQSQVLADSKFINDKIDSEFKNQIDVVLQKSETQITQAQQKLIDFLADLQKRAGEFEESSQAYREARINALFDKLETRLSDFLIETEQKTTSSIELELRSTRELIENYKAQQLKLIDENILAMMEQTLNIVLGKKLSLKDQLDLIYEAFEKAKVEKFIA